MTKKLTFAKWFASQHGQRKQGLFKDKTDEDLANMIDTGKDAGYVLRQRQLWDSNRQYALYAWQARDKQ